MRVCSVQQCLSPQDKLAYHQRSSHALSSGLYLGYLKLCSAVDQIRVLVPEQLPNILCHVKIRSNPNISRWVLQGSSPGAAMLLCLVQPESTHHFPLRSRAPGSSVIFPLSPAACHAGQPGTGANESSPLPPHLSHLSSAALSAEEQPSKHSSHSDCALGPRRAAPSCTCLSLPSPGRSGNGCRRWPVWRSPFLWSQRLTPPGTTCFRSSKWPSRS